MIIYVMNKKIKKRILYFFNFIVFMALVFACNNQKQAPK